MTKTTNTTPIGTIAIERVVLRTHKDGTPALWATTDGGGRTWLSDANDSHELSMDEASDLDGVAAQWDATVGN